MKFQIYRDSRNQWRWRLKAANGKTVADSSEGYSTKQACLHGLDLVKGTSDIPVEDA
jgi:uncharacterized protein YegP (UPF0339 family)